jgi:hypothetical protein
MGNAKQMASAGARFFAVLGCAAMLGACGGGGDSGSGTKSGSGIYYVPPPPVALASQADNLKNYLGTWVSGCGQYLYQKEPPLFKYVINTYALTALNDKTITGKFTQQQFSGVGCSVWQQTGFPAVREVTLTFEEKIQTPSSARVGTAIAYVGTADKMEENLFIIKDQQTIPDIIQTRFFTMGSDNLLRINHSGNFDDFDLRYTKQ